MPHLLTCWYYQQPKSKLFKPLISLAVCLLNIYQPAGWSLYVFVEVCVRAMPMNISLCNACPLTGTSWQVVILVIGSNWIDAAVDKPPLYGSKVKFGGGVGGRSVQMLVWQASGSWACPLLCAGLMGSLGIVTRHHPWGQASAFPSPPACVYTLESKNC